MSEINSTGIQIDRLDAIIEDFAAKMRGIYGQDIDLSPESPDGQLVGIVAQMKADILELLLNVYRQIDPDLATGRWLEQRAAYAGLIRKAASKSLLRSVVLTGTPGAIIPKGTILEDESKARWIQQQDATIGALGSIRADYESELAGAYPLAAGVELKIITHTLGFNAAQTTDPAKVGQDEETDEALRKRFYLSRSKSATASAESIRGKLMQLPDVRHVKILENATSEAQGDIPAHSFAVVVDGGEDQAIAKVINENKPLGVGIVGETAAVVSYGDNARNTVRFSRPQAVDVSLAIEIVKQQGTIVDVDKIKRDLSALDFNIGEAVMASQLYPIINQGRSDYYSIITSMSASSVSSGEGGQNQALILGFKQKARITTGAINITVKDVSYGLQ